MNVMTSVVHIGLHKTGSSTLQSHLAGSRRLLADQGFCYPQGWAANKTQHSHMALFLRDRKVETYEAEFQRVTGEFRRSGCPHLILSGEEFSTLRPDAVQKFGADLKTVTEPVRIILYVRNLYRLVISIISQHSKGGKFVAYPRSVIERMGNFNLTQKIVMWENVFGKDNVTVQCLETFPPDCGIEAQFAAFAGVRLRPGAGQTTANRSVDPISSALLTHLSHEFGVSHRIFYDAYFAAVKDRFPLPRTEGELIRLAKDWVEGVDVSHPKLAPFRDVLDTPPSRPGDTGYNTALARQYMEALASILLRTARQTQ
jgi:hypothetical protein